MSNYSRVPRVLSIEGSTNSAVPHVPSFCMYLDKITAETGFTPIRYSNYKIFIEVRCLLNKKFNQGFYELMYFVTLIHAENGK